MSDIFGGGGGGGGAGLGDLFDGLFRQSGGGTTRMRRGTAGPQRGMDVNAEVNISFEQAVHGSTLPLSLATPGTCRTCGGLGSKPGTSPRTCPNCGGSGIVSRNQGAFGFSEPCVECRGTGQLIDDPCPECHGSGSTTQVRTINVRIPAGVRDGAKVRVAGKGTPGSYGAPAGDLYVTVRVTPHPYFERQGNDIHAIVPVTIKEAYAGAEIDVPTIHGTMRARIPPGTQGRQRFRLRGKGVRDPRTGTTGDHIYSARVMVPKTQTPAGADAATLLDGLYEGDVRADLPKGL
jgi:molecular chaperone DnaJ